MLNNNKKTFISLLFDALQLVFMTILNKKSFIILIFTLLCVLYCSNLVAAVDEKALLTAIKNQTLTINPTLDTTMPAPLTVVRRPDDDNLRSLAPTFGNLNPIDQSYSEIDARSYASLSSAAYCSPLTMLSVSTRLKNWNCAPCLASGLILTEILPFRILIPDLYGYLAYNEAKNEIIVVFTGSHSIVSWIFNFNYKYQLLSDPLAGNIHHGFIKQWRQARPILIKLLNTMLIAHPEAKILITGHSLGGAIAAIATLDFLSSPKIQFFEVNGKEYVVTNTPFDDDNEKSIIESPSSKEIQLIQSKYTFAGPTYTFGQPRLGDDVFVDYFTKILESNKHKIYRVVHDKDIVPHLPPLLSQPKSRHLKTEVYYDDYMGRDAIGKICEKAEDETCSNKHLLPKSIDDHLFYFGYFTGPNIFHC
jgi:hypothetical protein